MAKRQTSKKNEIQSGPAFQQKDSPNVFGWKTSMTSHVQKKLSLNQPLQPYSFQLINHSNPSTDLFPWNQPQGEKPKGTSPSCDGLLDHLLGSVIQRASSFIQEEEGGFFEPRNISKWEENSTPPKKTSYTPEV